MTLEKRIYADLNKFPNSNIPNFSELFGSVNDAFNFIESWSINKTYRSNIKGDIYKIQVDLDELGRPEKTKINYIQNNGTKSAKFFNSFEYKKEQTKYKKPKTIHESDYKLIKKFGWEQLKKRRSKY